MKTFIKVLIILAVFIGLFTVIGTLGYMSLSEQEKARIMLGY